MAAFATPAELASALQVASVDTASATLALNRASGRIRLHCGWSISEETVTDEVFDGTGTRNLWIPTLRLTAVGSLEVDGVALVEDTDYSWTSYGRVVRNGCWPRTARSIVVTYTHGYPSGHPKLEAVKDVCLALAGRLYDNPRGSKASTKTAGPFTETDSYGNDPASALSEQEQLDLGKFTLEEVG